MRRLFLKTAFHFWDFLSYQIGGSRANVSSPLVLQGYISRFSVPDNFSSLDRSRRTTQSAFMMPPTKRPKDCDGSEDRPNKALRSHSNNPSAEPASPARSNPLVGSQALQHSRDPQRTPNLQDPRSSSHIRTSIPGLPRELSSEPPAPEPCDGVYDPQIEVERLREQMKQLSKDLENCKRRQESSEEKRSELIKFLESEDVVKGKGMYCVSRTTIGKPDMISTTCKRTRADQIPTCNQCCGFYSKTS